MIVIYDILCDNVWTVEGDVEPPHGSDEWKEMVARYATPGADHPIWIIRTAEAFAEIIGDMIDDALADDDDVTVAELKATLAKAGLA